LTCIRGAIGIIIKPFAVLCDHPIPIRKTLHNRTSGVLVIIVDAQIEEGVFGCRLLKTHVIGGGPTTVAIIFCEQADIFGGQPFKA